MLITEVEAAPALFPPVFAAEPKWLRRKAQKLRWNDGSRNLFTDARARNDVRKPAASATNAGKTGRARRGVRGWAAFRGPSNSDESESQQAGAEQGDATCGQGKKAVGNEISISHDTTSDSDARPNLLKLSE
jgi:hypothetical protein